MFFETIYSIKFIIFSSNWWLFFRLVELFFLLFSSLFDSLSFRKFSSSIVFFWSGKVNEGIKLSWENICYENEKEDSKNMTRWELVFMYINFMINNKNSLIRRFRVLSKPHPFSISLLGFSHHSIIYFDIKNFILSDFSRQWNLFVVFKFMDFISFRFVKRTISFEIYIDFVNFALIDFSKRRDSSINYINFDDLISIHFSKLQDSFTSFFQSFQDAFYRFFVFTSKTTISFSNFFFSHYQSLDFESTLESRLSFAYHSLLNSFADKRTRKKTYSKSFIKKKGLKKWIASNDTSNNELGEKSNDESSNESKNDQKKIKKEMTLNKKKELRNIDPKTTF